MQLLLLPTQLNTLQNGVLGSQAGLLTKQNTIADGHLSIANKNGLPSALDLKSDISDSYNKTEIETLQNLLEIMENLAKLWQLSGTQKCDIG